MLSLADRGSNIYAGSYSLYNLWGVWSGYKSTHWLNPPTAPPFHGWSIQHSYYSESWK